MKILITGITGQDGIFLTKLLNDKYKNFKIIGISRNSKTIWKKGKKTLKIFILIYLIKMKFLISCRS